VVLGAGDLAFEREAAAALRLTLQNVDNPRLPPEFSTECRATGTNVENPPAPPELSTGCRVTAPLLVRKLKP